MHLLIIFCFVYHYQNMLFYKYNKNFEHLNVYGVSFLFKVFFKIVMLILAFTKGGKSASPKQILAGMFFLQNFIFFYQYESKDFYSAGFLKIAFIVTP